MLYYYQNEAHQDQVVKVGAMKRHVCFIRNQCKIKKEKAMPMANDHVLASPIKSHDIQGVEKETVSFLQEVIGLRPVGIVLNEKPSVGGGWLPMYHSEDRVFIAGFSD